MWDWGGGDLRSVYFDDHFFFCYIAGFSLSWRTVNIGRGVSMFNLSLVLASCLKIKWPNSPFSYSQITRPVPHQKTDHIHYFTKILWRKWGKMQRAGVWSPTIPDLNPGFITCCHATFLGDMPGWPRLINLRIIRPMCHNWELLSDKSIVSATLQMLQEWFSSTFPWVTF